MGRIFRVLRSTRGVSMVEYAIMLALVAALCIGVIGGLGSSVNKAFKTVAGCSGKGGGFGCNGGGKP
ncbi:MAG TPA: Flp family type IVb pilin [Candidatus Baltobacteraceae bacterium]|nr:Flp family type IVb pilin [Candidatus Baltobacteraceae bacterium]